VPQPGAAAIGRGVGAVQRRRELETRRLERRQQREEHRCQRREQQRKAEHPRVNAQVDGNRNRQAGLKRLQQRNQCLRQRHAQRTREQRECQSFEQQLHQDAASRRANGEPRRDLATPLERPRQQHCRHIAACDEQDQTRQRTEHGDESDNRPGRRLGHPR
jgi:hypothetical protein